VGTRDECKTRKQGPRAILKLPENTAGRNYGYVADFLGRGCYVPTVYMKIDYQRSYTRFDSVPDTFSLLTYNIWGLPKPKLKRLFKLRKPLLLKTLESTEADMFCLQEMSRMAYLELADWINQYAFASEVPFPADTEGRNRSVEVYFVSRYRPKKITVYGITKTWIHYSRCRYDIMNMIYDMVPKRKAAVICGDFNFHLDGTEAEWPEMEMIRRFEHVGFVDTYRKIHRVGGLTEDTDTNLMRWNQKLMEKKYRYDGILYRPGNWSVVGSQVIGKDLVYLNEADSEWFYDEVSEAHKLGGKSRLRGVRHTRKGMRLPINASDHFGVLTKFRARHGAKTRKVRR
jgi:exonuclease III